VRQTVRSARPHVRWLCLTVLCATLCTVSCSRQIGENPVSGDGTDTNVDIPSHLAEVLPESGANNVWHYENESDTVFVFVHGIFSDSQQCWWYVGANDRNKDQFWPEILRKDPRFDDPSIFLGGFYTAVGSGTYGLSDCSNELWRALTVPHRANGKTVLDKPKIVFLCHSTGGIVVRHMLDEHYEAFEDRQLGVVLIASPSLGSQWADWLRWVADIYDHSLGQQLQWNSTSLSELDDRFKDLLDKKKIKSLVGAEAYENHFVVRIEGLPTLPDKIVEKISAGRYFGRPTQLANTDHFSTVKPSGPTHPSHLFIVNFYLNKFKNGIDFDSEAPGQPEVAAGGVDEPIGPPGLPNLAIIHDLPSRDEVLNSQPKVEASTVVLSFQNNSTVNIDLFLFDCTAHFQGRQAKWVRIPSLPSGGDGVPYDKFDEASKGWYGFVVRVTDTGRFQHLGCRQIFEDAEPTLTITEESSGFEMTID